jgi:hypothetical protein
VLEPNAQKSTFGGSKIGAKTMAKTSEICWKTSEFISCERWVAVEFTGSMSLES